MFDLFLEYDCWHLTSVMRSSEIMDPLQCKIAIIIRFIQLHTHVKDDSKGF